MQQNNNTFKINENRQRLKEISQIIRLSVKEGIYSSVNEGLAEMYRKEGHTVLKSYRRWKADGFQVKKGSKALLMWGEKKKKEPDAAGPETNPPDKESYDFFPVAYVFSNLQVEKIAH